jgi:hypothetical protein
LLHAATTSAPAGVSMGNANELSTYLEGDTVTQFDDSFSIINWWHEHKSNYPVLSILARDVLTVPVSTYLQNLHLVHLAVSSRSGNVD